MAAVADTEFLSSNDETIRKRYRRNMSLPSNKKKQAVENTSSAEDELAVLLAKLVSDGLSELAPSTHDQRDKGTDDEWIQRNPDMIRLTGKHPFNAQAPLDQLAKRFITPVPLHYVRNHGAVPKTTWDDWTLEISGLVMNPTSFSMDQLLTTFPSMEFPVTLVCSANRRKEQNMTKQTLGFNWGCGAVSTSLWKGVPLWLVLQRCGVFNSGEGAEYVVFEGGDSLPAGGGTTYGTSVKLEYAMDPTRDIILAYKQNGETLTPDHGYPLRVIVPGFTAGRMVKWLKRIIISPTESDNHYHYHDNRVLPTHVDSELAKLEGWYTKPEHIINELGVNSAITAPSHGEMLALDEQESYVLKGYAYTGGGRKVTRVEVTLDAGKTWKLCRVNYEYRPSRYGKHWAWCFWMLSIESVELLAAREIAVRAWDESHNTQPDGIIWNLMGMMNNSWYRVRVNVRRQRQGNVGIEFRHPVVPGNQSGGWMESGSDFDVAGETKDKEDKAGMKSFAVSEVEKHNTAESPWIVVNGYVYDCTHYLKDHPGGANSILINAGTDCTEEFQAIHSDVATKTLQQYLIGRLSA